MKKFLSKLAEVVEIILVIAVIFGLLIYPGLCSNVYISYDADTSKIQLSGSKLALSMRSDLQPTSESTIFNRVYECSFVEDSDISKLSDDAVEVFTAELNELATQADRERTVATIDENGFLLVYDPYENLEIEGDIPVFVVPIGEQDGYIFGFAPATAVQNS